MQQTKGACPYCNTKLICYNEEEWKYGSPIRICRKCKQEYLNSCYHEIVIDGIDPDAYNAKRSIVFLLFGLGILGFSVLYTIFSILFLGSYSGKIVGLGAIGILIMIYALLDIICMKTGLKKWRLDRLKEESDNRMKNQSYAHKLYSLGFKVPKEYL